MAERENRASRSEIYPQVGTPAERLQAATPIFGKPLIDAVVGLVESGTDVSASLQVTSLGENPQVLSVNLSRDGATRELRIELTGDWDKGAELRSGTPLMAGYNGKFSTINPTDGNPMVGADDWIAADAPLGVATKGKGTRFMIRLPRDKFPQGATFIGYAATDGQDVEPGTVLCYVEKTERS